MSAYFFTRADRLRSLVVAAAVLAAAGPAMCQPPAVTAPVVQQFLQPNNGEFLRTSQILGVPTSFCDHVIDLMMENQVRQQLGINGTEQLHLPHLTAGLQPGDLQLLSVHLVSDGDAVQGPVFQICMRNESQVPIGRFHVSLVGVLGQIHIHSPTANICINRMEAGEERAIQVQLPVTCMNMGPFGQQAEFDTLVVALDSYDRLLECDELNNVQILQRADVTLLVEETTVSAVADPATPAAPADPAPVDVAPQAPAAPAPPSSPLDNLDLDNLQLDEAQNQNLFVR